LSAAALRQADQDPIDIAIEAKLDRAMGASFFCKPTVAVPTLGLSPSSFYRGVNTKVIPVVEHMDGIAVIRPVMHMLLRNGVPNMTGKPPLLQLRPANSHNNRKAKAEPARAPPAPADRQHQSAAQPREKTEPAS
jgi:hypothetical protein